MKETLDEIEQEMMDAFSLLSMISVRGDDVDRLAEARNRLRKAFQTAKAIGGSEKHTGGGDHCG